MLDEKIISSSSMKIDCAENLLAEGIDFNEIKTIEFQFSVRETTLFSISVCIEIVN